MTRTDTTPDTRSDVCTLLEERLENGWSINRACDYVGVSVSMYYGWKDAARRGDDEAILLLRRLKRARAKGLDKRIGPIEAASEEDWRAAAWLVTKQYPDLLSGQVEEIEVPEPDDREDLVARQLSSPDRLQALAKAAYEYGLHHAYKGAEVELPNGSASPVPTEAHKEAAKQDTIMRVLWGVCASSPYIEDDSDGIDREEAILIVKAAVPGTYAVDVKQAASSLGLDERDHIGIGQRSRKTWKVVEPPPWADELAAQSEAERGPEPPQPEQPEQAGPQLGAFAQGTGDAITRSRRRA